MTSPASPLPSESLTWEERINTAVYKVDRKLHHVVKEGLSGENTFYAIGGAGLTLLAATAIGAFTFRRKAKEFARMNPAVFARQEAPSQASDFHKPQRFIPLASAVLTPRETVKLFVLPFIVVSGGIGLGWKVTQSMYRHAASIGSGCYAQVGAGRRTCARMAQTTTDSTVGVNY
ncbi:hypothetical protein FOZ60_016650 [Perkinsus olseni]|uniref:Uncharacterized protein n=1 Tax=Perkinsus olseni TaxID=32597 RepID=A0A7J6PM13_PEROL|nr:hypothetical protein FOZ60_016650 [Perkinsus olseni]